MIALAAGSQTFTKARATEACETVSIQAAGSGRPAAIAPADGSLFDENQ
jgi:hypothetical protein